MPGRPGDPSLSCFTLKFNESNSFSLSLPVVGRPDLPLGGPQEAAQEHRQPPRGAPRPGAGPYGIMKMAVFLMMIVVRV